MVAQADREGVEEPEWSQFLRGGIIKLNDRPTSYLMGQSVNQTYNRSDGRPRESWDPEQREKTNSFRSWVRQIRLRNWRGTGHE